MSKGNPDRRSYYNHIWLEGLAGKTEFDENSVWGADEWEKLFHAFKRGEQSFEYGFNTCFSNKGRDHFEGHLRSVGIPCRHEHYTTTVDVTKIISIEGYEVSAIFGWRTDWK
jgi:hypothetical protein